MSDTVCNSLGTPVHQVKLIVSLYLGAISRALLVRP